MWINWPVIDRCCSQRAVLARSQKQSSTLEDPPTYGQQELPSASQGTSYNSHALHLKAHSGVEWEKKYFLPIQQLAPEALPVFNLKKYRYRQRFACQEEVLRRPIEYTSNTVPIRRVKRGDISPEWFLKEAACKNEPIIVEDVCNDWPAMERWSVDALEERFRHVSMKVAKDDKGKKMRMKFKYYADYVRNQQDDTPLYLFETNMDDNGYIRPLMEDYE
ncbi:unnamed protein product, partial [Polarella glacialis]